MAQRHCYLNLSSRPDPCVKLNISSFDTQFWLKYGMIAQIGFNLATQKAGIVINQSVLPG